MDRLTSNYKPKAESDRKFDGSGNVDAELDVETDLQHRKGPRILTNVRTCQKVTFSEFDKSETN